MPPSSSGDLRPGVNSLQSNGLTRDGQIEVKTLQSNGMTRDGQIGVNSLQSNGLTSDGQIEVNSLQSNGLTSDGQIGVLAPQLACSKNDHFPPHFQQYIPPASSRR